MTTLFINEQIDMGLNDLMLELSKQLADIVKPMVYNKIQMAQQQINFVRENSAISANGEILAMVGGPTNQNWGQAS